MIGLSPPYGTCGEQSLRHYNNSDSYTWAKCSMDCKTSALIEACGCKDAYMPGIKKSCKDAYMPGTTEDSEKIPLISHIQIV
jgi:hypothetical protein